MYEQRGYHEIFNHVSVGFGTWSWGDRMYWGFGKNYSEQDLRDAFNYAVENGVTFFDTSEVYGQGRSEKFIGQYLQEVQGDIKISTKFMPLPWRLRRRSLLNALQKSLSRLGLSQVDLYQLSMPLPPVRMENWLEALVEAYQNNLIKAIGVSNFDQDQMIRANEFLQKQGIALASNQVEYNLLDRTIEKNGLLAECKRLNIRCIAYSPIGQGALSGKYSFENPMQGFRSSRFSKNDFIRLKPLIELMKKIGSDHGGKTASQVAINWVKAKGALPIPGVKNLQQSEQNCDVAKWELSEEEVSRLDEISDRVVKIE